MLAVVEKVSLAAVEKFPPVASMHAPLIAITALIDDTCHDGVALDKINWFNAVGGGTDALAAGSVMSDQAKLGPAPESRLWPCALAAGTDEPTVTPELTLVTTGLKADTTGGPTVDTTIPSLTLIGVPTH